MASNRRELLVKRLGMARDLLDRLTARVRSPWGVGGAAFPPPTERNFALAASTRCQL